MKYSTQDTGLLARLRGWARAIKTDIVALYLAARDPRVPWHAKLVAMAVAAYALSPIDLIPDFIPVLGYLDDVILVPLGILLAVRLIPPVLMDEFRAGARMRAERPMSRAAAWAIVVLWFLAAALLLWFFWPRTIS
ncbi:YkvA family protein [Microvirga sp. 2TAF3]|uniref:YkvA family protein n=1 Tax=Microvirga sp. 2TAF3 TaxID=3233014 RepID=UPI003F9C07BE